MESKFKISVLAASVVMGLGFTSVALAVEGDSSGDKKTGEKTVEVSKLSTLSGLSDDLLNTLETNKAVTDAAKNPFTGHFKALDDNGKAKYNSYKDLILNHGNEKDRLNESFTAADTKVKNDLESVFLNEGASSTNSKIGVLTNGALPAYAAGTVDNAKITKIQGIIDPIQIHIGDLPTGGNSLFKGYSDAQKGWTKAVFDLFTAAKTAITTGTTPLTAGNLTAANNKAGEIEKLAEIWAFQEGAKRSLDVANEVWDNNSAVIKDFKTKVKAIADTAENKAATSGTGKTLYDAWTSYQSLKTAADAANAGLDAKKKAADAYVTLVDAAKAVGTFSTTKLATDITTVSKNYKTAMDLAADSLGKVTDAAITALTDGGAADAVKKALTPLIKDNKLDKLDGLEVTKTTLTTAVDSLSTAVTDTAAPSVAPAKATLGAAEATLTTAKGKLKEKNDVLKAALTARDAANGARITLQNNFDAMTADIASTAPSAAAQAIKDRTAIFDTVTALQSESLSSVTGYATKLNDETSKKEDIEAAFEKVIATSRALAYGGTFKNTAGTDVQVPAGVYTDVLINKLEVLNTELGDPAQLVTAIDAANKKVAPAEKKYDEAADAYNKAVDALRDATDENRASLTTKKTEAETALKAAAATLGTDGTTTPLADVKSVTFDDKDTIKVEGVDKLVKDLDLGLMPGHAYTAAQLRQNPVAHTVAGDTGTPKAVLAAVQESRNAAGKVTVRTFSDMLSTRGDLINGLENYGAVQRFAASAEQANGLYTQYDKVVKKLTALDKDGKTLTPAAQEALQASGPHTLYLGGLTSKQASELDGNGNIASLLGLRDKDGKLKTTFTQDDIYTGKKEKVEGKDVITPVFGTVFSVTAPQVSADISKDNTITVGGKDAKTPMDVYASTFRYRAGDIDKTTTLGLSALDGVDGVHRADNSGAAIAITGNLKTGIVVDGIGEKGKEIKGLLAVKPDKIVLHDMNVFNSVDEKTLDGMLRNGNIRLLKTDPNQPKRGTDHDPNYGVATGLLIDSNGINSQIANSESFGQIANGETSPVGIELKNVNITVRNGLAGKEARAIDMTGSGNHIKVTGGVITAETKDVPVNPTNNRFQNSEVQQQPKGAEVALLLGGHSNFWEFDGTKIKGDIVDTHDFKFRKESDNGVDKIIYLTDAKTKELIPQTNIISIANGTLDGDVYSQSATLAIAATKGAKSGKNTLNLRLDHTTWTGWSGNSNDLELKNGSVWNVREARVTNKQWQFENRPDTNFPRPDAHVNSLVVSGGVNTIDLAYQRGNSYVSGKGPGVLSTINAVVEQDLTVKKDGVLRINARPYSADEQQRTGGLGSATGYQHGSLIVKHLILGETAADSAKLAVHLQSSAVEPVVVNGRLATRIDSLVPYDFVTWKAEETRGGVVVKSNVDLSLSPVVEAGVYQYQATQEDNIQATQDGKITTNKEYKSVYFVNNGQLSNSAATVAALAASPASIASMESDALAKHMNSLRHSDSSGVWISYYGGSNKNRLNVGTDYDLKTNGVMLGVDTQLANKWLAGVAFTSAKSSLNTMQSTGDVNSYGAQFYLSRRYENGVFVDANAQFGHFSNRASARMLDGVINRGDYSGNGYGLGVKLGYAYQNQGFFAEPYVRATGRAFSGASYILNGMNVNSTDYKSVLGEIGADLGFHVPMNAGYFKPYLHLAVLDEFANGNHVRVNNIDLNNSINGAAFQVGIGAEVQVMKNFGGYVSYDYTTGSGIERPWQATVGVNYTW